MSPDKTANYLKAYCVAVLYSDAIIRQSGSHRISVVPAEDLMSNLEACLCSHSQKSPTLVAVPKQKNEVLWLMQTWSES